MLRPNPAVMSHSELDDAISSEMAAHPDGTPYGDHLHDEFDRRDTTDPGAPSMLSLAELDDALNASSGSGTARFDALYAEHERRHAGPMIDVGAAHPDSA